jgi:Ca2+-binding RTX toxin-like protein
MVGTSTGGRDTLIGSAFGDRMSGDAGRNLGDSSRGGADSLDGRNGDDELLGDAELMFSFTRGGDDVLRGGAGADKLYGDAHQQRDWAIGGSDKIYSGSGNDEIWGDGQLFNDAVGGQDKFYFNGNFGDDRILDFRAGEDQIYLSGVTASEVEVDVNGGDTILTTFSDHSITLVGFTGLLTSGDLIFSRAAAQPGRRGLTPRSAAAARAGGRFGTGG